MARRLFFASIAHLPLLLMVLMGEAFVRAVVL
jgi:heme O synthase-like polyprenyltransferase